MRSALMTTFNFIFIENNVKFVKNIKYIFLERRKNESNDRKIQKSLKTTDRNLAKKDRGKNQNIDWTHSWNR